MEANGPCQHSPLDSLETTNWEVEDLFKSEIKNEALEECEVQPCAGDISDAANFDIKYMFKSEVLTHKVEFSFQVSVLGLIISQSAFCIGMTK